MSEEAAAEAVDVPIWADRLVIMLMAAGFPARGDLRLGVRDHTGGPETHGRSPAWTVDPQATEHSDYWRSLWELLSLRSE
jgi:hypothetical protein